MASTRHLGLGVIETRWFDERHHTVRPLFEFLSYALKDRSDAFTYERFVGAQLVPRSGALHDGRRRHRISLRRRARRLRQDRGAERLGPVADLPAQHVLRGNRRRRRLKGVLFGSCKFGDEYNLIEVLRPAKIRGEEIANRLVWAGGYSEEIDYTRSSLFDISFFDLFFRTNGGDEIKRLRKDHRRSRQGDAGAGRESDAAHRRAGCAAAAIAISSRARHLVD